MRGAALVAVTFATASCSWLQSLDKDQTLDWSADKLYSEARLALDDSNWTQAKDYYHKLEARYPFGQYAQQAQIELIYATWKDGDAPGAVQADSWFNKLAAEDLAERDANASREAFDTFKELALRYPDSRFAPEARRRMHGLVLAQAEHELKTAQYYFVRHAYVAAIDRAQRVVREFQNTPMRDDALELIAKSYDALKITDLAADTRRIIELNKNGERSQPSL